MKPSAPYFYHCLIFYLMLIIIACNRGENPEFESWRNQDFNLGWRFLNEEIENASDPDFDDSQWRTLDLPHDWSIEDYPVQDSVHSGPFKKGMDLGSDVGHLRGGTGWYRKTLTLDIEDRDKQVFLHFDGVQTEMILWVNGTEVGRHVYGYSPFFFNITPFVKPEGSPNQIAIKVFNPERNSRWFNGAGIYRPVSISLLESVYIDVWGVFVTTPQIYDKEALVNLDLKVRNNLESDVPIHLVAEFLSPEGELLKTEKSDENLPFSSKKTISLTTTIPDPLLWDLDHPHLYKVRVSLFMDGEKIDAYELPFGIRSISFSVEDGFMLNGKQVLLKGACMHHDNGLLGSAAFKAAEERKVRLMKHYGYNAIRTSHNPPSGAFLDACDQFGMLVIDESFDMWVKPKRPNDYHLHFEQWWEQDQKAMLLRDRNHPSIIMWSFGNEVQERVDPEGLDIAARLSKQIKKYDSTRPVTQAICGFWDNPGKVWDDSEPAFALTDVGGYNYKWQEYENDHKKYPSRIMYGSESFAKEAYENWEQVKKHDYVIGDFIWTGMDYIGESGIGHSGYYREMDEQNSFHMPWPWYISWCGDIDLIGNKKPQSYFRDVVWEQSKLEIMVHEPVPEGKEEKTSYWGWPREFNSWNWKGYEGVPLRVNVYSSYPEVRLELNGKNLGTKSIAADSRLTASFSVPYKAGELKAIGIKEGEESEIAILTTTGSVKSIQFITDPEHKADKGQLIYIDVLGIDGKRNVVPDSNMKLTVEVTGEAKLIAAGNAAPQLQGSMQDKEFQLFQGRALLILRSTGRAGIISCQVSAPETNISQHLSLSAK